MSILPIKTDGYELITIRYVTQPHMRLAYTNATQEPTPIQFTF